MTGAGGERKPRPRHPSDDEWNEIRRSLKGRYTMLHNTIAGHPRYGGVWEDVKLRGMLVELWRIASVQGAAQTADVVRLSAPQRAFITGCSHPPARDAALRQLIGRMRYSVVAEEGTTWLLHIRNFAKKQGTPPRKSGVVPADYALSSSSSSIEEKSLAKKPPRQEQPNGNGKGASHHGDEDPEAADPHTTAGMVLERWSAAGFPMPNGAAEWEDPLVEACGRHELDEWLYLIETQLPRQRNPTTGGPVTLEFLVAAEIRSPERRREYAEERWLKCWRRFYAEE
jgi:hypothetical protein